MNGAPLHPLRFRSFSRRVALLAHFPTGSGRLSAPLLPPAPPVPPSPSPHPGLNVSEDEGLRRNRPFEELPA